MAIDNQSIIDGLLNKYQNNTPQEPQFEFDRLKMYFGEPYYIKCGNKEICILQPKIGDILTFGEKDFYSMLYTFVANPTSYRLQLWDMGLDWNKISDFELFCLLVNGVDTNASKIIFGDLDFKQFHLFRKDISDNDPVIVLYNPMQDVE